MFHQSRFIVHIITDNTKKRFLEPFFTHSNNHAFNDKTNCFYPAA